MQQFQVKAKLSSFYQPIILSNSKSYWLTIEESLYFVFYEISDKISYTIYVLRFDKWPTCFRIKCL